MDRSDQLFFVKVVMQICVVFLFTSASILNSQTLNPSLQINDKEYYEKPGLNILVFSNWYDGNFDDSKISGVEIIHHGVRTVTNGDVRLSATPSQWDPIPKLNNRKVDQQNGSIQVSSSYTKYNFDFKIETTLHEDGILLSVILDKPIPKELENLAGFNLEFLPSAYFEKTFMMDDGGGIFPLYPSGPMRTDKIRIAEPLPLATGKNFVAAPEDINRRIVVKSLSGELSLYDGRNQAQNGWYVLRSLIPSGKTGKVIEWFISASTIPNWIREPMIAHSQVGYHPKQNKTAVIELDMNDTPLVSAKLLKVNSDGTYSDAFKSNVNTWGKYLRYNYATFDFSSVSDQGIYVIEYGKTRTQPFRIAEDVFKNIWAPTLDVYLPVQMDHMFVNEAYRVWHGAAHLDDALQAPINYKHFDLYEQGPTTGNKYKPLEHIPGLNIGGWFDAGDYDIRTQTQCAVIQNLVQTWEMFSLKRDETYINQKDKYVDLHHPDGIPDILQQVEHGVLALLAQHRSVGYAINGIIEAHLSQYTHLGDASTITDNLIYNSKLDSLQADGFTSGTFDDRWAFTNKSTPLNYSSASALAASSRILGEYNNSLADECLSTAEKIWDEEHTHAPDLFRSGNTTGGQVDYEEFNAALELLISTKDKKYAARINELQPVLEKQFGFTISLMVSAIPYMDEEYKGKIELLVKKYKTQMDKLIEQNPFGVPITTGGWAGSGIVVNYIKTNYLLHKTFPEIISNEYPLRGINFIFGCHPGSNVSLVSAVGTHSKRIAYGNNRADFSFIAGGVVPGMLILKPDFPENKEDWPFLWGENEYVVNLGASFIFVGNAVNDLFSCK